MKKNDLKRLVQFSWILLSGELRGFCDVSCCCCSCFTWLETFHPLLSDIIPYNFVSYYQVYPYWHLPILYFQSNPLQSNLRHFHFSFLLLARSLVVVCVFYFHQCYLWGVIGHQMFFVVVVAVVPRVLRFLEGVFYTHLFFTLHSIIFLVLPQVLRISEGVFYSQALFTLHFIPTFLHLSLRIGSSTSKIVGDSCWSLKHISSLCLNHTAIL